METSKGDHYMNSGDLEDRTRKIRTDKMNNNNNKNKHKAIIEDC